MEKTQGKPLISYVVTTYNIEKFVEDAVKCAFAQTYSPLEIVLSDDCSSDRTFEIMKRMAEEYNGPHKIVLNRNETNLGITKHMNKAYLELASGEIIVAAHGDDISLPERTELMYDYLKNNEKCMQVACSAIAVNEKNEELSAYVQKNFSVFNQRTYIFGSGGKVPVGFSAFRKQVMKYFGPLNEKCPTEDDPIGFRAIILGEIAFLPNILIRYRKHAGSNSRPELFDNFPLDEIFNQNLIDMNLALSHSIITLDEYNSEKERLWRTKERRKVYRNYFRYRNINTLFKLVTYHDLTFKMRLFYLKEHFEYLLGHHE